MNNITHRCDAPGGCCPYLERAIKWISLVASDPARAAAVSAGYTEEGEAFVAFLLSAGGIEVTNHELQEEFHERYVDTYKDWYELREAYVERAGWDDELRKLESLSGELLGDFLRWDDEAIHAYLHQRYELLQTDERVFAFEIDHKEDS